VRDKARGRGRRGGWHLQLREEVRYFLGVDEEVVEEEEVVLLRLAVTTLENVERAFAHVSPVPIHQRIQRLLHQPATQPPMHAHRDRQRDREKGQVRKVEMVVQGREAHLIALELVFHDEDLDEAIRDLQALLHRRLQHLQALDGLRDDTHLYIYIFTNK
jgi:hypothetical protein